MTAMQTQEVVVKLLRNVGTRKEVEQYLRQFTSVEPHRFAVVRVTGGVLLREMDALVSALAFLHSVGLRPVVVHGAGPQLDEALDAAGIATTRIRGLRVTPPEALDIVKRVMQRENLRLVDALEKMGVHARPITSGVFEAEAQDEAKLGLVGQVRAVHLDAIQSAMTAGALPIVASLGETRTGQILNINAVVATRALTHVVQPYKVLFLNEKGGLRDGAGQFISAINLAEDYPAVLEADWVNEETRHKLEEIKHILDGLPPTSSVSITEPDHVARELFTHKGSGTLVRQGERVQRFDSMEGIDPVRLRTLLETCFGRALKQDYFETRKFFRVYLADSYRATAILTNATGTPYLDKFAVTQEAQGGGVGSSIWRRMIKENPVLFWRARKDNPINPWYFEVAAGSYKSDKWIVFWCGLTDFEAIKGCIEHALSLPATLVDAPTGF
jgi:acetylglutamate kinase